MMPEEYSFISKCFTGVVIKAEATLLNGNNFRTHFTMSSLRESGLRWLAEQHFQITNTLRLFYILNTWILQIQHPKINEQVRRSIP